MSRPTGRSAAIRRRLRFAPWTFATTRLAELIRFWLLQRPISAAALDRALPGLTPALLRAGFVRIDHEHATALVDVRPYAADERTYWICADLTPGLDGEVSPTRPDLVLGVSAASTSLAQLTPRGPVGSALDLGTGCGVQSLHLAGHAQRVVATDLNPRAIELAEVTLGLNRVDRVELRQGDLFAPVAEDAFELISTNPPYVMSPPGRGPRLAYREGNSRATDWSSGSSGTVQPGWHPAAPCRCSATGPIWPTSTGRSGWPSWIPAGCDAHFVERELLDPSEYAEIWLADAGLIGRPGYRQRYAEWLDYFQALDIEAVGLGWITIRRSETSQPSIRIEPWPYAIEQPVAAALTAELDGVEMSRSLSDDDLLATRLVLAEDVREESTGTPGAADPQHIVLRQQRGLRRGAAMDTALGGVVGACDGELPSGVLIDSVAVLLDVAAGAVRADLLPRLRRLLVEGFLTRG